jgi:outer membrane protein assembly factor BamB/tetratricopeptide (TPR) repeat protein
VAFQGDVAHIPLSNILQALLLNNQEGVLTLEAGAVKRRVRVLKQGLRLLNYSQDSPDLLKQILIKQKLLTESQFQNIFSSWVPGSSYPGDFLVTRRILTREIVTNEVCLQLENLILELIFIPDLKYEFTAEADGTPYELFAPDDLGAELILNSNAVLMEAVRRDDDWKRIREVIPSTDEIFTLADRNVLSAKNLDVDPKCLKELKPLLNGENSVERIITATTMSAFQVQQTIFQLKQKGLVRPLDLQEKRNLAEKLRKSLRSDDAIHIFRSILLSEPKDQQTRLRLVSLIEKKKDQSADLVEQYLCLANDLAATDPGQCKAYLQKVLAILPHHLGALEQLFDLYRVEGNHRDALSTARSIVLAAKTGQKDPRATEILYKIVNFYPEEAILFHELADIHIHARDIDAAVECLKTVAELYERRHDVARLRKTCEQILRLKPSESSRLKKLIDLERKGRLSFARLIKLSTAAFFAVGALALLVFIGITEYTARVVYADILRDVEVQKNYGELAPAKASLEHFERVFPFSTCIKSAQTQLADVNKMFKRKVEDAAVDLERRRIFAESHLTKVRIAMDGNDYVKASDLLAQVDVSALKPEIAQEVNGFRETINKYFAKANELLTQANAAEQSQEYPRSHQLRRELLKKYPSSKAAVDLLMPVRIETIPPGSDLLVEGQAVGQTPMLLRLPPRKLPVVTIVKKGYKPVNLTKEAGENAALNPIENHVIKVQLLKSIEWQFSAEAPIEGFAAVLGENVCLGTRSGRIYCIKQDSSDVVWTFSIPQNMDFAGGIGAWNNLLYFGSFDGRIYVLEAATGKLVHEPFAASQELWPIKHAPSAASESGLVAVNCDKKLVAAYSLTTGKLGWSISFPASQVLGQPQAYQGNLYLATSKGEVLEVEHETGRIKKRIALGFELNVRGRMAGGQYFVGNTQGKLSCLDPAGQQLVWSYDCGAQITSPPTVDGEWVIVPTADGKLHCVSATGEAKWVYDTQDVILPETDGMMFRNHFLIGTKRGVVLCMDLWSGNPAWSFKTAGYLEKDQKGILSNGVISRGRFFIGSEDHFFYCFSLD